jgi:hypothetical protein
MGPVFKHIVQEKAGLNDSLSLIVYEVKFTPLAAVLGVIPSRTPRGK